MAYYFEFWRECSNHSQIGLIYKLFEGSRQQCIIFHLRKLPPQRFRLRPFGRGIFTPKLKVVTVASGLFVLTVFPYIQLFLATADDTEDYNGAVEAATTLTGLHFMSCSILRCTKISWKKLQIVNCNTIFQACLPLNSDILLEFYFGHE